MTRETNAAVARKTRLLEEARMAQGLSFGELGRRAGLPKSTAYDVLKGNREPYAATLELLAAALGVELPDEVAVAEGERAYGLARGPEEGLLLAGARATGRVAEVACVVRRLAQMSPGECDAVFKFLGVHRGKGSRGR